MDLFSSNLTENEQLKMQVEALKRDADIQEERQRLAIMAAENFLTFLRRLYGDII